ncbi:MAG: sigma-70 family RNA polymerase sigma factor [Oscillospiraceae bacterium]|nr:sigma-70 family RNA polymerase sigma factor [Oscillospiraceae bacterium]
MLRDYHAAEDITQDVFIDGYLKLNSLSDYDKIGGWLAKIAKNKCCNYLTREVLKYRRERELDDFIPDTRNQTPESYVINRYENENLERAVKKLPDSQKTATILFYFENCSQKKIAEILHISENAVKQRLYEARLKLKKELDNMSVNINTVNFEEEIAKKIKSLKDYYHLHNFSIDGREKEVGEFIEFINNIPDSKLKHYAYSAAYQYSENEEYRSKIKEEAELGENADMLSMWYINENLNKNWQDKESFIKGLEADGIIQKLEKMLNSKNAVGELLFWRGASYLRLDKTEEAKRDFQQAFEYLNIDNTYRPAAASGLKAIEFTEKNGELYSNGNYVVDSETYRITENKAEVLFQPGFSNTAVSSINTYPYIYWFSAACNRCFYDLTMKPGDTITGKDSTTLTEKDSVTLTLISYDEEISVIAGTFKNCMHTHVNSMNSKYWQCEVDTWYAKDVGIVKINIKPIENRGAEQNYELYRYKLNGGSGYMPAAERNLWSYKNINIPDEFNQLYEYEVVSVIDKSDGKYMYCSALSALQITKLQKYSAKCDSDTYIMLADNAAPYRRWDEPLFDQPKNRDFDAAIKYLKFAVQKNSSVRASLYAAIAVDYVERFKQCYAKDWHVSPCGLEGRVLIRDNREGKIICNYGNYFIGPSQDWSQWWDERKCLARSPFRYLQELFGIIYNDKWVAGYSEQIKHEHGDIYLKAEDGGTVTTKAGTFEDCIKVTVELEKTDETDERYYVLTPTYSHCGTKVYYYAPNVGIIKYECIWGKALYASMELSEYKSYATNGEYMPVYVGNTWIYDEVTIQPEYVERMKFDIVSGMENEFFMVCEGEMFFKGTEEEFGEFQKSLDK